MRVLYELIAFVRPDLLGYFILSPLLYVLGRLAYKALLTGCAVWLSNKALNRGIAAKAKSFEFTFESSPSNQAETKREVTKKAVSIGPARPTPLGEALRILRVERRLTLADTARILGIAASEVSEIENGIIQISDDQLNILLNVYSLPVSEEKRVRSLVVINNKKSGAE